MLNQAKLVTGEIINYSVYATNKDAFTQHNNPAHQYVGVGYFYVNGKENEELSQHFWVRKKNYSIAELQKGDKVLVNLEGNLTWVVMSELIGNTGAASMIRVDGSNINYPFRDVDILYIEEGNTGISIIKSTMAKEALLKGGYHLSTYVSTFGEMPLQKGDYIEAIDGYEKENNSLKIRNSHRILNQGDLVFEGWYKDSKYATVKSVGLNKTAFLALNSIRVKKVN